MAHEVNALTELLTHLEAQPEMSGIALYAGENYPPAPRKPSDGPSICFRPRGGVEVEESDHLFPSMQFKCFGSTPLAAWQAYMSLSQALEQPGARIRWAGPEVTGQALREPETNWPYVLAFYQILIRNKE